MLDYTVTISVQEIIGIINMEDNNLGISVIMPSYLGNYGNKKSNSVDKLIRAVNSFINQSIELKELIIVSDGCEKTNQTYFDNWKNNENIRLIICERYENKWPGNLREMGRCIARYDWITYLDSDDMFLEFHLNKLVEAIKLTNLPVLLQKNAYLPYIKNPNSHYLKFISVDLSTYLNLSNHILYDKFGNIETIKVGFGGYRGTWQISHKNNISERWKSSEFIGEDADFIKRVLNTNKFELFDGGYLICSMEEKSNVLFDF